MQFKVWIQQRTSALENFIVDAMNEKEAAIKAIKEAERVPVWEKPTVQLKVFEVEPIRETKPVRSREDA